MVQSYVFLSLVSPKKIRFLCEKRDPVREEDEEAGTHSISTSFYVSVLPVGSLNSLQKAYMLVPE